jgi:hypothetical protein
MAGGENYPVLSRRKQALATAEAAKQQLALLRQEKAAAAEAEAECVMKYQERDRPYPISMKVLEKLCRHDRLGTGSGSGGPGMPASMPGAAHQFVGALVGTSHYGAPADNPGGSEHIEGMKRQNRRALYQ